MPQNKFGPGQAAYPGYTNQCTLRWCLHWTCCCSPNLGVIVPCDATSFSLVSDSHDSTDLGAFFCIYRIFNQSHIKNTTHLVTLLHEQVQIWVSQFTLAGIAARFQSNLTHTTSYRLYRVFPCLHYQFSLRILLFFRLTCLCEKASFRQEDVKPVLNRICGSGDLTYCHLMRAAEIYQVWLVVRWWI